MVNRPQQLLLRYAKGPRVLIFIPLLILIVVVIVAVFIVSGEVSKPAELIGPIGFGVAMLTFLIFLRASSSLSRARETRAIERFFDGDIWAQWGFGAGELPMVAPRKGTSRAFKIWFGPGAIYHESEGLTRMMKLRLVEVNYLENFYPQRITWADTPGGRRNRRRTGSGGGETSAEFIKAMETSTIGDETTPKIEFKLQAPGQWWRGPGMIYFPVAKGHEHEAKMLVQRYQQEVVR